MGGLFAMKAVEEDEPLTLGARVAGLVFRSRRKLATGAAVVVAVLVGYHVVFGANGLTIYQQKRLEDRTLARQIHELQDENGQLKAHVDRLQSSPDAIEHEAREKLHYARPGEVIYTLDDKAAGAPAGATAAPAVGGGQGPAPN